MNKTWSCIFFVALVSLFCVVITLLSAVFKIFSLPSTPIASFGSFSLVAYLMTVSAITAWLLNILLEEFVKFSNPLPLPTIKYYIIRARQIGLLTEEVATTFLREPNEEKEFGAYNFDANSESESNDQQMRAEMQCEVELLLNELHRLLVASWFDSVSPKDPDFPRATRQALAKVALELQARAGSIKPTEATRIALLLLISHLHKIKKNSYQISSPIEDGSAKQLLELISEALISFLAWPDVSSKLGGKLLSSLLAHGALLRALNVVSSPGWLSLQIAQAITGESTVYKPINTTNFCDEAQPTEADENAVNVELNQADMEAEAAVQEACTPADDIPDFLEWSSDLPGHGPRLWGPSSQQSHVSQQAEQPSVPQIIEHGVDTGPVTRKASEAEWLNPSPPRQQLGLQLSKSSQDLRQVAAVQCPADDLKSIKKELSLGSFVREETSMLSHRVREAGCDVLGSLRARATSHLSALLSPAREMSVPPAGNASVAESLLEPGEGEDEVSPVYEEASDLATSIAKLRALLQHHDHKSSSEEDDMVAVQPGEVENQSEQRPVWDIHPDGDVSDSEWMEAEEAPELPNDGRMIMNIRIPATELSCDTTGQQFVQYCIQYDAVYVQGVDPQGSRLVLQTTNVKRRFQEFLNLQTRLEENPNYRSALRAVKGPSKWLSLAFSKAGHQTTAARLPVLERFLQQLCEQPVLARSAALQHFLAYDYNGSEQAVTFQKHETSDLPRLDKILARTVSGVFHSIKTALPSFDFELSPATSLQHLQHGIPLNEEEGRSNTSLPGLLSFVSNRPHPRTVQTLSFKEKIPQGRDLSRDLQKFLASRVETGSDAWIDQTTKASDFSAKSCILVPSTGAAELNWQSKPLSSLAEELFELLFPDSWITNGVFPLSIRTLLKEWTEERLQVMACDLWSLKSAVCCLRVCRAALAPGNSVRKVSREEGQAALQSALYKCFPVWMQFFIGSSATQNMVGTVNQALYEEHVNQQLFLNLSLAVTYVVLSVVPNT